MGRPGFWFPEIISQGSRLWQIRRAAFAGPTWPPLLGMGELQGSGVMVRAEETKRDRHRLGGARPWDEG